GTVEPRPSGGHAGGDRSPVAHGGPTRGTRGGRRGCVLRLLAGDRRFREGLLLRGGRDDRRPPDDDLGAVRLRERELRVLRRAGVSPSAPRLPHRLPAGGSPVPGARALGGHAPLLPAAL